MNVEFTEITFDNKSTADEALKELRQWHKSGVVKVFNAAVLVKDRKARSRQRDRGRGRQARLVL